VPKALEAKLKREYGAKSKVPYKIMNKMGVMRGSNKITAKGKAMEAKPIRRHHGAGLEFQLPPPQTQSASP
jgi:hypothetical protein